MDIKALEFLRSEYGEPQSVQPIAGAGSNRRYYRARLSDGRNVIVTCGDNRAENRSFIYLADRFRRSGLPVPEVLTVSADESCYVQTDVGSRSLYDELMDCGVESERGRELLTQAVRILARFHVEGSEGIEYDKCLDTAMDRKAVLADLNYFRYCFLKTIGAETACRRLDDEFEMFADEVAAGPDAVVMLRDFQSRNIMISADGAMSVIDFQGARRGPAAYDLVSLLWQSRLQLPAGLRRGLVDVYIDAAGIADREAFLLQLPRIVILRTLQTLGTYGFRGLVERKEMFVKSIPEALRTLQTLPDSAWQGLTLLRSIIANVASMPRFMPAKSGGPLVVKVVSFAYKMGLPVDDSGNGGGFVFDCRAIHNPGRYQEYKCLTGRDEPVIKFIEQNGDAEPFLKAAFTMVDASVDCYIRRGFNSLSVAFGCTGGRHRSVYCAERMASHLARKYADADIQILLTHREQKIVEQRK